MNVRVPDRYIGFGCESDGAALEKMAKFLREQGYEPGVHGNPCIWDADQPDCTGHKLVRRREIRFSEARSDIQLINSVF